ncbi:MAG TPA: hypothetical protein VGN01_10025 [Acidobacteriaceae bacterium]|jgi:hypothetical protein
MDNGACVQEVTSANIALEEIGRQLHELCQPLTTLQCRLELSTFVGTIESYREAVAAGLEQCSRLVERVESMREILHAVHEAEARTATIEALPGPWGAGYRDGL